MGCASPDKLVSILVIHGVRANTYHTTAIYINLNKTICKRPVCIYKAVPVNEIPSHLNPRIHPRNFEPFLLCIIIYRRPHNEVTPTNRSFRLSGIGVRSPACALIKIYSTAAAYEKSVKVKHRPSGGATMKTLPTHKEGTSAEQESLPSHTELYLVHLEGSQGVKGLHVTLPRSLSPSLPLLLSAKGS